MLIPREFAINGTIWRIEYKWNLTYNKSAVDGLLDPATKTIFIDRSLSKEDKWWTFVHEFIHAVLESNEIGHNSNHQPLETSHEEDIITAIESELKNNFTIKWKKAR